MSCSLIKRILLTGSQDVNIILTNQRMVYTFLNPVSYLDAVKEKELFNNFDGLFADGSILTSAIFLLYGELVPRRSFDMTSMAPLLFEFAERKGKSISYCSK